MSMANLVDKIDKAQGGQKLSVHVIQPTQVKVSEFNFRALPYKHQDGNDPFIIVYTHSNIGKDGKQFALCPEATDGGFCPYCEAGRKIKDKMDKEEWKKIAKKFYPQKTVYIPGIARYTNSSELGFLKVSEYQNFQKEIVGILTSKQLKELFNIAPDVKYITLWDIKNGVDFVVNKNEKSASSKFETFTIKSDLKLTPAIRTTAEKEILVNFIKETPNIVAEMRKVWGCSEKITEAFISQYPKYAVQFKLVSPETETTNPTPNVDLQVDDSILPQTNNTAPADNNEDLDALINEQVESSAPSESASSTNASPELDDEYNKIMESLQ